MFQSRCEAIKRVKIFGGIDLNLWLHADMRYSEFEMRSRVKERVDSMIMKGGTYKRLTDRGFELTPDEVRLAHLGAANDFKLAFENKRRELVENHKDELKSIRFQEIRSKKAILRLYTNEQRLEFALRLEASHIITNSEVPICAKYLEDFADLIPQKLIDEFISPKQEGK